ncbi:YeeE/YedE family protein, partial [Pantoea ananatis]
MHIDLIHFTPWQSLAGGLLIGAAAGMLVLFCGRIAGISGILG